MKKVFVGATIVGLALFLALPASAAISITKVNDSSTVTSLATWLINVLMANNNNTGVTNSVTSSSNSGNNVHSSTDDHSGSLVETGSSDAATLVDNQANQNAIVEEYEASQSGPDVTVDDVNDSSTATATQDDTLDNDMTNDNEVDVTNTVDADGDSGNNAVTSADSLSDSTTDTGGASGATTVLNGFNINVKTVVRRIMSLIP